MKVRLIHTYNTKNSFFLFTQHWDERFKDALISHSEWSKASVDNIKINYDNNSNKVHNLKKWEEGEKMLNYNNLEPVQSRFFSLLQSSATHSQEKQRKGVFWQGFRYGYCTAIQENFLLLVLTIPFQSPDWRNIFLNKFKLETTQANRF